MVWIERFIWSGTNEEQVARHGVTRDEVDEIVFNRPLVTTARDGLFRVVGQTNGGRYLTAFVAPRSQGRFYVVTARDATGIERRAYSRR